ncbi:TPA: hypothetical protein SLG40_000288 [Serratia odorifera]|nr:hypothetical protein [Serratia odorifera]
MQKSLANNFYENVKQFSFISRGAGQGPVAQHQELKCNPLICRKKADKAPSIIAIKLTRRQKTNIQLTNALFKEQTPAERVLITNNTWIVDRQALQNYVTKLTAKWQ